MTSATEQYLSGIRELQDELATEVPAIEKAAELVASCIGEGGVAHVFGSGHSHMMAEEVFHRAGGLMAFNAMLDINLTSFGTLRAGQVERQEGYAPVVLNSFDVRPGEVVIVVSNSGINPVTIDLAIEAKKLGASTIAITSASAYAEAASRHSSGKKLSEVCDLTIDSHVPVGDAILELDGFDGKVAASSTPLGAIVMNMLVAAVSEQLIADGKPVPALMSQNIPGGDEYNKELMEQYRPRMRMLR